MITAIDQMRLSQDSRIKVSKITSSYGDIARDRPKNCIQNAKIPHRMLRVEERRSSKQRDDNRRTTTASSETEKMQCYVLMGIVFEGTDTFSSPSSGLLPSTFYESAFPPYTYQDPWEGVPTIRKASNGRSI